MDVQAAIDAIALFDRSQMTVHLERAKAAPRRRFRFWSFNKRASGQDG
jgi:hypothetical protein